MIAEIRRTYTFEAAHRLPCVPDGHKCGRVHGHSYRVTVHLRGSVQCAGPEAGMVVDFGRVDAAVKPLIATLDHRPLNEHPDLYNPTSEIIARWFVVSLRGLLPMLHAVTVSETERSEVFVLACDVEGEGDR